MLAEAGQFIADGWQAIGAPTPVDLFANKWARAIGMMGLVFVTI